MGMCQSKISEKVKPPEKKKPILCGAEKIEGEVFTLLYSVSLVLAGGIID